MNKQIDLALRVCVNETLASMTSTCWISDETCYAMSATTAIFVAFLEQNKKIFIHMSELMKRRHFAL